MSEQTKAEQDGAAREEAQFEPAEVSDSDLEKVSGGQADWDGAEIEVEQQGGGNGDAPLTSNPPR